MRPSRSLLGCAIAMALAACQPRDEAAPATSASAASPGPAASAMALPPPPAAPVSLAATYANGAALLKRHEGVYTARIDNQPAVLWIGPGNTVRQGDEAVTLPRLVLYRESRAGHPDVVVDLQPVDDRRFDALRACPVPIANEQGPVERACDTPGDISWTRGLPSQWPQGRPLEMAFGGTSGSTFTGWARETDIPTVPDEKAREGSDWFDAVVARTAAPLGPQQHRGDSAWQPMRHGASGVEWDRPVAAAQPAALAAIQREVDRRAAIHVALALEAGTQQRTAQALLRVRYASPQWLVMEASDSEVGADQRSARTRQLVWDQRSGKLVRLAEGFRYATLKRPDGSIALDLGREPSPGAEADRGVLSAALRAMGPRAGARCMQRWLEAHGCGSAAQCTWQAAIPADLVLFPTDEGLGVQFDHAAIEAVAKEHGQELPEALRGPAWSNCVQDRVVLSWAVAKQARRSDSQIELP